VTLAPKRLVGRWFILLLQPTEKRLTKSKGGHPVQPKKERRHPKSHRCAKRNRAGPKILGESRSGAGTITVLEDGLDAERAKVALKFAVDHYS
jgi:hypothetical protein